MCGFWVSVDMDKLRRVLYQQEAQLPWQRRAPCSLCSGTGKGVGRFPCAACRGSGGGVFSKTEVLDDLLRTPAGRRFYLEAQKAIR